MTSPSAIDILASHSKRIGQLIETLPARMGQAPPRLIEAMMYSLRAGGKRLRPALVLESYVASGGKQDGSPLHRSAEAAALAVELIHTFSLIHDDLPAMDNDDLRRGVPTNHKVFGDAMAILAGDALHATAHEILACDSCPTLSCSLVKELAYATGPSGMVGGQVMDILSENASLNLSELSLLHRLKTGALLIFCCRAGGLCSQASPKVIQTLTSFGQHLGLAFQITDDILDVTSTPQQLGKATNKDAAQGKNTFPTLMGLEQAKSAACQEIALAEQLASSLGPAGAALATLARFVGSRQH